MLVKPDAELLPVAVLELSTENYNGINESPEAQATECKNHEYTRADASYIETVNPENSKEPGKYACHEAALLADIRSGSQGMTAAAAVSILVADFIATIITIDDLVHT